MGANNIELIEKYSVKAWDIVYKAEALSSLLEAKEGLFEFTGAKTVRIATFTSGGLNDYYRANAKVKIGDANDGLFFDDTQTDALPTAQNLDFDTHVDGSDAGYGYQKSNLALNWNDYTIKCDRAARFQIELVDNEETNGLALAASTTEISRTAIIPEVDAYCFAKIAAYTSTSLGNRVDGTFTTDTATGNARVLTALNEAILWFDNHEVPAEKQMFFVSPKFLNALRSTPELVHFLTQVDYGKDVKFTIFEYEGRKIVMVPPQRFNTGIELYNGGYRLTGSPIDFLALNQDAAVHIVRYQKEKVLAGDLNLAAGNFDGYSLFARIYHDVFVLKNKRIGIYCHTGGFATYSDVEKGYNTIELEYSSTGKIKTLGIQPAHILAHFYQSSTDVTDKNVMSKLGTYTKLYEGGTFTIPGKGQKTYVIAVDSKGNVVAKKVIETPNSD